MADLNAASALANANAQIGKSITPQGMCLNFVWRMYGAVPSTGDAVGHLDTAWNSWSVVKNKHLGDRNVPAGYFAMLGPSPTRTDRNKNAGDIIISRGDGTFVCTDANGSRVGVMTLAARERQTARPFVGWGADLGNHIINGPQTKPPSTEPAVSDPINQGDEGVDRLIRNKKTGSIDWINTATGFAWHVPNSDYEAAIKKFIGRETETMEDNWHGFYLDRCTGARDAIASRASDMAADKVWAESIKGANGAHPASARLAGADVKAGDISSDVIQRIVSAIPVGTVETTPVSSVEVDIDKLAAALAPLVAKAVNDDAAKRMQD
jgi:hypothetical protein